jgi:CBS domain-containing protein
MNVQTVMNDPVVTCTTDTTVSAAARLMRDANFGTLPVIDARGHLAGIITDRDVCLAFAASARNPSHVAVHEVMTRDPITVRPTDTIQTALGLMKKARVRRLPVLDVFGHLQGMVSIEDIVVRGLESGGVGSDEIVLALRTMYERRPVASGMETS